MNRLLFSVACLAVTAFAGVVRADDLEQYQQIRKLLQEGKVSAAEETFEAAIGEFPDSARLKGLHYMMYYYTNREGKHDAAIKHLEAYIQQNLLPSEQRPEGNLSSLTRYADQLVSAYKDAGKLQDAGGRLDYFLTEIEPVAKNNQEDFYAQTAVRELKNRKLVFLAEIGQQDEARTILTTRLGAAKKTVEENPDDAAALLDLVFLLKGAGELAAETGSDQADEKQLEFLDRLRTEAKAHQDNLTLVVAALNEHFSAIGSMALKQPLKAETLLANLKEFAGAIESEHPAVKGRLESFDRATANFERSIKSGKYYLELIGKESFPLTAEAWVNGEPLTDADLKGKVVLLDFWAVWCGPCIATFPHLREWQEKYQDKGLVIVGVTRYYNYGWDEEANRPKREEEITPEDEQAAMVKFAEHHELKHRFMITPKESTFQKDYGVSGIPQAVLIDREGKIRLIRVGSGSSNAEDLDKLLAELIGVGN